MTAPKLQSVRGMNDILPGESEYWMGFEALTAELLARYGYRQMRTPLVEHTALFKRAIGEVTDIVEKEMYAFEDALNGEHLTLRPEGTASAVRAAIEHSLLADGPQRLYYYGPMFRHERPQKGRYRQFHQVGVEAIGFAGPDIDAELIMIGANLWDDLGISEHIRLEINSLGSPAERQAHRTELVAYLEAHADQLDEDGRRRLHTNPLRILDTKNPALQELVSQAPRLLDFLGSESLAHFEGVQALLRELCIPYTINPRLVRGLDYYNLTVFEWVTDMLGAQGTVCAGGRYDGLFAQLGGKPAPAAGFALGIERLLALWQESGITMHAEPPEVYVVHTGEAAQKLAFRVGESLRGDGFSVVTHCGGGSFKSQFKRADASGALFAVVIGDDEAAAEEVTVKPLRDAEGQQTRIPAAQLSDCLTDYMFPEE